MCILLFGHLCLRVFKNTHSMNDSLVRVCLFPRHLRCDEKKNQRVPMDMVLRPNLQGTLPNLSHSTLVEGKVLCREVTPHPVSQIIHPPTRFELSRRLVQVSTELPPGRNPLI